MENLVFNSDHTSTFEDVVRLECCLNILEDLNDKEIKDRFIELLDEISKDKLEKTNPPKTIEEYLEAIAARKGAEELYGFHENHGRE